MPKQALESLTESMFYLLMALTQGERCGTEITAFAAGITAGRVKMMRDTSLALKAFTAMATAR